MTSLSLALRPAADFPRTAVTRAFASDIRVVAAWFFVLCAGAVAPFLRAAEPAPKPEPLYETRAEHDPNGIGKFFMGREIAHVMGHQAWEWLERPEREQEERTDLLLEALKLRPGETVADIGAGSGYFSWRMARLVGETGTVYAVDIQQEMLDLLMKQMTKERVEKIVKPILGNVTDPKLPAESCDTMLLVDVYHEFDFPFEMISRMVDALKPEGRIVFVEFRKEDPRVPIKEVHKMSVEQVKKEMNLHRLRFAEAIELLPQQHIIIFRKTK
jgi:ubiquinone/menaquinone biosynthesis C-methylase UbiE